jgi:hypothetical protein
MTSFDYGAAAWDTCHPWDIERCDLAILTAVTCWPVQVRQLQSLGFTIRASVLAEVDTANRFYRYGLVLKQVQWAGQWHARMGSMLPQSYAALHVQVHGS